MAGDFVDAASLEILRGRTLSESLTDGDIWPTVDCNIPAILLNQCFRGRHIYVQTVFSLDILDVRPRLRF